MKVIILVSAVVVVTCAGLSAGMAQFLNPTPPAPTRPPTSAPTPAPVAVKSAVPTPGGGAVPTGGPGPKIHFAEPVHDFGKIKSGDVVKHTFVFENKGEQTLQLTDVRPSCGCTTAGEWDRQVEPGKTGKIPIQFSSANFGGPVMKTVTVTCNDTTTPTTVLQIKGTVWKPIDVTPMYIFMNPFVESATNETRSVKIVNNQEEPLTITEATCNNSAFKTELKTLQAGKEFEVLVTALAPFPVTPVSGVVSVKTSSTNMPMINITASLMPQQAVSVLPSQINLPAGPLRTAMRPAVSIRNNGTNSLIASNATVNAQGVDVQLQTTQPGRLYSVTLTFPVGYQIPTGEKVELTIQTSHPQHPVIKVPVYQSQTLPTARPAGPVVGPQIGPQPKPLPGAPVRPQFGPMRPVTNALTIPAAK